MEIGQAFDQSVEYYDDWMKKALPGYEDLFQTARDLIPFDPATPIEVLDLGAGTGLFSAQVRRKYPLARFTLCDVAEKLLSVARERFRDGGGSFEYLLQDYRTLPTDRTYDLVISSLSIHHLEDSEKQALFRRVFAVLKKPGLFLNVDQIRGETQFLRDLFWRHWLDRVRESEPSEQRIRESIERRTTYDRDSLLTDQLGWLRQAGFLDVDCVYRNFFVGVFFGRKV